jgi:SAM-dependent methyltransferase
MEVNELNAILGNIDVYLLDQILKGRFDKQMRILDAGCGEGRNCIFFLHQGYRIFGCDANPLAVQMCRITAKTIDSDYDVHRFQKANIEDMPFHAGAFDVVLSSAVLHFARSETHFFQLMDEMMRVLKPGGLFFLRMCTDAGNILANSPSLGEGVYLLPDGSERFVLSENLELQMVEKYGLEYLEAPKSVIVHGLRSMGVFVMRKID